MSGSGGDGGYEIVEEPQPGVVDRRLQAIVKGLQGALRKAKLVVLDMAALVGPIEGRASAELEEAFMAPGTLVVAAVRGGVADDAPSLMGPRPASDSAR